MNARRLGLLVGITVLITTLITSPVLSANSASIAVAPLTVTVNYGSTNGSVSTLGTLQQSDSDDDPGAYVLFQTPSTPYLGYATYQLPPQIRSDRISSTLLQVNFKGPHHSQQTWSWSIYNWTSRLWIPVGDTIGSTQSVWNTLLFPITFVSRYASPTGEIRIRLASNNADGDAKLDYQALHFTYLPITPTATRPSATAPSTRPPYVFPTTFTPTITPSPTHTLTPTRTFTATPTGTFTTMPSISLVEFETGFSSPTYLTHANDGTDRIFVVERCGKVKIIDSGGNVLATPFLDISTLSGFVCGGEQGLFSIVFPPNYASKDYFYAAYTISTDNALRVARFHVPAATPNNADETDLDEIITIAHPDGTNHNAGQLAFGNDGYLYISTGDGGGGGDIDNDAQNTANLLGKILRIHVEGGAQTYSIPASNPFVGVSGSDEIWAFGLRNPWRFSFDRLTHDLYVADVGQNNWEEVNFQAASSSGGENYGWRCYEGNHDYNTTNCQSQSFYDAPAVEYSHSLGCSVTGGYVYRGSEYPNLQGTYVYGDFCSGRIWGLKFISGQWENQLLADASFNISSFGEDEAGNLYLTNLSGGVVYKVTVP